jgi:hypothetical protein
MTVGQAAATANSILSAEFKGTSYSGNSTPYLKLYTGDPGAAGTANASAETTRQALSFGTASAGSIAASEVTWSTWSAGAETITHVGVWTAASSGTFICSGALSSSKTMANGDTLGVTITATQGPVAA